MILTILLNNRDVSSERLYNTSCILSWFLISDDVAYNKLAGFNWVERYTGWAA